jgi:hypothetical protein
MPPLLTRGDEFLFLLIGGLILVSISTLLKRKRIEPLIFGWAGVLTVLCGKRNPINSCFI